MQKSLNILRAQINEKRIPLRIAEIITNEGLPSFKIYGNYPNPFNSSTTIRYSLPVLKKNVRVMIFNILGQPVKILLDSEQNSGYHEIVWDGSNDFGVQVPSGVYFYRIKAGNFKEQKKLLLLR